MSNEEDIFVERENLSEYPEIKRILSKYPNLATLAQYYYAKAISDKTDYCLKFINEKIFGSEIIQFIKSYNHRHKSDIKSLPGLEDFIFSDEKNSYRQEFFLDPIKYRIDNDSSFNAKTWYRSQEGLNAYNFEDNPANVYDTIENIEEFSLQVPIKFSAIDFDNYKQNHCCSDYFRLLGGDSQNYTARIYLSRVKRKDTDRNSIFRRYLYDNIRICIYQGNNGWRSSSSFFIRYIYDEIGINSEGQYYVRYDGYNRDHHTDIYEKSSRGIYILCNRPLFSNEQVKFFIWFEKILNLYEFSRYYFENFSNKSLYTSWLHQLVYKMLYFSDNPLVDLIDIDLNNMRNRKLTENIYLNYLSYLPQPGNNRLQVYDEYQQDSFRMNVGTYLPKYLDLKNHSFFQTYRDIIMNEPMINEPLDRFNNRIKDTSIKSIKEILDDCNLARSAHFDSISRQLLNKEAK